MGAEIFNLALWGRWAWIMKLTFMMYQLPGASQTAASFQFEDEDHTLGNTLRFMIMKKYAVSSSPCDINDSSYIPFLPFVRLWASTMEICRSLKPKDRRLIAVANSPEVEFCGYSIPHPSEPKMNVRIQTYGMLLLDAHGSGQ